MKETLINNPIVVTWVCWYKKYYIKTILNNIYYKLCISGSYLRNKYIIVEKQYNFKVLINYLVYL